MNKVSYLVNYKLISLLTCYSVECHTVQDTKYVKECETKVRLSIFFKINQPDLIDYYQGSDKPIN